MHGSVLHFFDTMDECMAAGLTVALHHFTSAHFRALFHSLILMNAHILLYL
jgi:hypothetical protein